MKIYTRKGDSGTTSLYDGTKLHKSNEIFDALGDLDELSVAVAVVFYMDDVKEMTIYDNGTETVYLDTFIRTLQRLLLDIGSVIANAQHRVEIDPNYANRLELYIDWMTERLPPLRDFILPGVGNCDDVPIHHCRVVCRRAERKISGLTDINPEIGKIMNRLSDFFFTLARYVVGEDLKRNDIPRQSSAMTE